MQFREGGLQCQTRDGKGWIFIDTGDEDVSQYEIKRCEACQTLETDLAAFEAVEKIVHSHAALLRFVECIGAMKHEGEPKQCPLRDRP